MRLSKTAAWFVLIAVLTLGAGCGGNKSRDTSMSADSTHTAAPTAVTENELPAVLDFSATWCPPCRQMKPEFESVERKYASRVRFVTIDVDDNEALAREYGIQSIPTIVYIDKSGKEAGRSTGYRSRVEIEDDLNRFLPAD